MITILLIIALVIATVAVILLKQDEPQNEETLNDDE